MQIPLGHPSIPSTKVWKLQKSLCGLNQAIRQWFSKLSSFLISHRFEQCKSDYSLFIQATDSKFLALLVYVDDILFVSTNSASTVHIKTLLHQKFWIKDLGTPKFFLSNEIARSHKGISICQRKYVLDLLEEVGFLGCKSAATPLEQHQKYSTGTVDLLADASLYCRLVGKLLYLTITGHDLSHSVHILTQFIDKPRTSNLTTRHRILRYLKSCPGQGLFYSSTSDLQLKVFCDSN